MERKGPLSEAQLERFERCYGVYLKKGNRGQAEKTWSKINPDDRETEDIYQSILAQNRYHLDAKFDRKFLRLFSTWLNDFGWRDEIGSHAEARLTGKSETCIQCQKNETMGPKFKLCADCYIAKHSWSYHKVMQRAKEKGYFNKTTEELRKEARALFGDILRGKRDSE